VRSLVVAFAALVLTSCGGSDLASSVPLSRDPELQIAVHEGGGQLGEVGTLLPVPVTVRVTDIANGNAPISGQLLVWVISKGAGRVDMETTRTDAAGYSRQYWTLGTFAGQDSMDVWLVSSKGDAMDSTSVGAVAMHGPAIAGGQQCDPIAFTLAANVAIPIVDSVRVYARDRFNNVWPYDARTTVQDVRFSGRTTGSTQPPASFTARTITLAPSSHSDGQEGASWQGGWVVTLGIEGLENASCTIGASAH
jgi:hypothetical protein